ncbi:hypothetical protein [Amycolatopsis sp. 195334CR]|uniref:hypothetical protein n=1 Tax=Amycolatopsis sp. 195334CR TaxID=2814588 RepID=UPI001A8E0F42|nr:hypothetical protein [Amycolatopsis sp. 195334CR]MBN6036408.1 hypothetical protein [Amycolatopsis sp. 195334CR]
MHNPTGWTDALGLTESSDLEWVDPNAPDPASTTGRTWQESFQRRFRDPRNRGPNGEPVPDTGLSERPGPPGSCGGGGRRGRRRR